MRQLFKTITVSIAAFLLFACEPGEETGMPADEAANVSVAEKFIDAFYSFDSTALESFLDSATESVPSIVYYQGWAEGGNYKVHDRKPCVVQTLNVVSCSITVEDDPMLALGIDFKVTDTFEITFAGSEIISV